MAGSWMLLWMRVWTQSDGKRWLEVADFTEPDELALFSKHICVK